MKTELTSIDQYIKSCPKEIQAKLEQLRKTILKAAPKVQEKISYGMPAFYFYENLVYFAANKNHIGFYPTASPIVVFKEQLKNYKTSKGAIQFPSDEALPLKLISDIVKLRLDEALERAAKKNPAIFLESLSAPAKRALENEGIKSLKKLSKYSEADLLKLHGFGKSSLPILRELLETEGLSFKDN